MFLDFKDEKEIISIPKVVRLSLEELFNASQVWWNFNPKSGSIKLSNPIIHERLRKIFQSQKWFD